MDIKRLQSTDRTVLHEAFLEAFADYSVPIILTFEDMIELHQRRAVRYDLSVGAFDGSTLAGFTFNGFGTWNGRRAGYDAGTGVIPAARGKKLAGRMMDRALEVLAEEGAKLYLLEVIQSNTAAFKIYESAGFRTTRELLCWSLDDISGNEASELEITKHEALPEFDRSSLWSWTPSWQNSTESLARAGDERAVLVARVGSTFAGYAVVFRRGDVAQFAVSPEMRGRGIGRALMRASRGYAGCPLGIRNTDGDDEATTEFLRSIGARETVRQFEMTIDI